MLFVTLLYLALTSGPLALLDPVPDAVYDSINAVSGCMTGTRQEVIGRITEWIDGRSDLPISWLYGAAGSGKSAISKTVAELYAGVNRLGASFFFHQRCWTPQQVHQFHTDSGVPSYLLSSGHKVIHRKRFAERPSYNPSVTRTPVPKVDHRTYSVGGSTNSTYGRYHRCS
jgi:hypothetical protein